MVGARGGPGFRIAPCRALGLCKVRQLVGYVGAAKRHEGQAARGFRHRVARPAFHADPVAQGGGGDTEPARYFGLGSAVAGLEGGDEGAVSHGVVALRSPRFATYCRW